jgi:eukaryotic-like serine/threonine-protein kinase
MEFIRSVMQRQVQKDQQEVMRSCNEVLRRLSEVQRSVSQELGGSPGTFQANQQRIVEGIKTTLGFSHLEKNETKFQIVFAVQRVGGQIGVYADAKLIAAGDSLTDMEPALSETVRSLYLEGIRSMFDGPGPNLLHHRFFRAPPHGSLEAARQAASARNMPVFAVLYDDKHSSLSRIDFALGYFLEYESTRNLVEGKFITVLVPVGEAHSAALVPADDPLETARLVILAADGSTLASETVYPNADEGLKRVQGFLNRLKIG